MRYEVEWTLPGPIKVPTSDYRDRWRVLTAVVDGHMVSHCRLYNRHAGTYSVRVTDVDGAEVFSTSTEWPPPVQ